MRPGAFLWGSPGSLRNSTSSSREGSVIFTTWTPQGCKVRYWPPKPPPKIAQKALCSLFGGAGMPEIWAHARKHPISYLWACWTVLFGRAFSTQPTWCVGSSNRWELKRVPKRLRQGARPKGIESRTNRRVASEFDSDPRVQTPPL